MGVNDEPHDALHDEPHDALHEEPRNQQRKAQRIDPRNDAQNAPALGPFDACSPLPVARQAPYAAAVSSAPTASMTSLAAANAYAFPRCPSVLGLYAVVPDAQWVERVIDAGVRTVQLRAKSTNPHTLKTEVQRAVAATKRTSDDVALFINDHWKLAIEAGAYGVHLGQEDVLTADFDAIAQAGLRVGLSTHGYHELMLAIQMRPSYIACGAIFGTRTKDVATPPQGLLRLARYQSLLRQYPDIATVAIGGIDESRLPGVLETGVGGVAVISAIIGAPDWPQAIARLQSAFNA